MKTVVKRFQNETPDFFNKIAYACASLATIGIGIQAIPETVIKMPDIVYLIGQYCIAAGIFGAAISKMTVKDPTKLE